MFVGAGLWRVLSRVLARLTKLRFPVLAPTKAVPAIRSKSSGLGATV
ncbi:hypothetical protein CGMCC3_g18109, partial [Colletotrichum fructicola]